MIDVSIIIINYNTTQLLKNCINSIIEKTFGLSYEIIVIDNASYDNPEVLIKKNFPNVKFISSQLNLGFGKANNLGVLNSTGKYLFFLNSDTLLINNAIKILFDFWQTNPNLGAIGGNLFDEKHNPNFSYGTHFPTIFNIILYRTRFFKIFKLDTFNYTNLPKKVSFIIGADLFMERSLFLKIKGFDPNYFMYIEDGDLQLQINRLNYFIYNVPNAKILHLQGASSTNKDKLIMEVSSYSYYFKKNYNNIVSKIYQLIELSFSILFVFLSFFNRDRNLKNNYLFLSKFIVKNLIFKS